MDKKIELDIVIVPEGEGQSRFFSISSVQFPNVVTQGKTIEEAKNRLREAMELYFEELPEEKQKILFSIEHNDNAPMISRLFI